MSNCTFTVERTDPKTELANNLAETSTDETRTSATQTNSEADSVAVVVGCVAGKDGGKPQTFHLIGLLAVASASANQSHGTKPLSAEQQHIHHGVGVPADRTRDHRVSSIIELIQSIQSSGQSATALPSKPSPAVHWNVSTNEVPRFVLANVTVGQQYHLTIYASNQIGRSEPLVFPNLVLLDGKPNRCHWLRTL